MKKYLQEATEKHEAEDNYYDGCHQSTNTSPTQQEDNYLDDEKFNTTNKTKQEQLFTPESHQQDTGTLPPSLPDCYKQLGNDQDDLATIPEEDEEIDPADQDTLVIDLGESDEDHFDTTIDTTSDDSAITMGKPVTAAFISDLVQIPTDKVSCLHVTHHF